MKKLDIDRESDKDEIKAILLDLQHRASMEACHRFSEFLLAESRWVQSPVATIPST